MNVSIIILNWNGWKDTIECLESVLNLSGGSFRVVVCDNASTDGSTEKIKAWARGDVRAEAANPDLAHLISRPSPKPIPFLELARGQAESGTARFDIPLVLIHNGANLGFAGGENVGIRYALRDQECQFFWMLNNDTVVAPGALAALLRCMQERKDMGLCGSLNLSYTHPNEVQSEGGNLYSRWTGRVRTRPRRLVGDLTSAIVKFDYINGASMLASRNFLEQVGLMDESYFLYFEELDWAMRAKGRFGLGYTRDSVIFHKEGATIGSSANRRRRSLVSERYLTRSRVLFTRRFFPWALPTVLAAICFAALERLCSREWYRGREMLLTAALALVMPASRTAGTSQAI